MAVLITDDDQLRHVVYVHDCAVVMYIAPACEVCNIIAPQFEKLSQKEEYKCLLFLTIDSGQNPIAKQFLAERATPLVVTYHTGKVVEAQSAESIADVQTLVNKLMEHRQKSQLH